jgi:hypothetical protein
MFLDFFCWFSVECVRGIVLNRDNALFIADILIPLVLTR